MNFKLFFQIVLLLIFSITTVLCDDSDDNKEYSDILIIHINDNGQYNDTSFESITNTMKKYSINYDRLLVDETGIKDLDNVLYIKKNNETFPKYNVVVFPDGRVSYNASNPETGASVWRSAITSNQWEQFYDYSRNYDVRLVFLNEYPSNYTGTTLYQLYESDEAKIKYQSVQNIKSKPEISNSDAVNSSNLTTKDIYHYPAKFDKVTKNKKKNKLIVEELLYFEANEDFKNDTLAAVTVDYDGAQYAAFFMAFGDWSTTSSVLNVVWLTWAFEKDFRFLSGTQHSTEQVIKESNGSGKSTKIEILIVILSTVFSIIYSLL